MMLKVKKIHSEGGWGSQGYGYNWKREEAVAENIKDGGALGSAPPPRKSPSSPSITLLAGFDAREMVGATENESARLKLPEASSGFEGGGFRLAICSANF